MNDESCLFANDFETNGMLDADATHSMFLSEQIPFGDTFGEAFLRQPDDPYRERKIAYVSICHNWRERFQNFVCKYPFRGSVRIHEDIRGLA